jgi:hypothetical protein
MWFIYMGKFGLRLFSKPNLSHINTQHSQPQLRFTPTCLWRWDSVLKWHLNYRCQWITQKKAYNHVKIVFVCDQRFAEWSNPLAYCAVLFVNSSWLSLGCLTLKVKVLWTCRLFSCLLRHSISFQKTWIAVLLMVWEWNVQSQRTVDGHGNRTLPLIYSHSLCKKKRAELCYVSLAVRTCILHVWSWCCITAYWGWVLKLFVLNVCKLEVITKLICEINSLIVFVCVCVCVCVSCIVIPLNMTFLDQKYSCGWLF